MNIIICVDDRWGMAFNGRRVSSDERVTERIALFSAVASLRMNAYSSKLFDKSVDVYVGDDFLSEAERDDFCFVENVDVSESIKRVKNVIVYRWNRKYPSDLKFPIGQISSKMRLVSRIEFEGKSHEKITEERYSV